MRGLYFMRKFIFIAIFCVIAIGQKAYSDTDEGLYDPVAPEGSAFVRFVNMGEGISSISANNKKYDKINKYSASPYYVVPEGNISFVFNNNSLQKNIKAGSYYTISNADKIVIVKDIVNQNRAKATLDFYNYQSDSMATLKAKNGSITVLENVLSGEMKSRDINPVKIDLSIKSDKSLDDLVVEPFIMERGNNYSVFYNGEKAFVVTAVTDTRG